MRKKSAKRDAAEFKDHVDAIIAFLDRVTKAGLPESEVSWVHEYAVIRLHREFERMMLECLVAAINNDAAQLFKATGVRFPAHLTDEACEYIITGGGFLDFRGREGLIKTVNSYVAKDHYLSDIVSKKAYREALEHLYALRNMAAHKSAQAKRKAKEALGVRRLDFPGSWLKSQGRLGTIAGKLRDLAREVEERAPY